MQPSARNYRRVHVFVETNKPLFAMRLRSVLTTALVLLAALPAFAPAPAPPQTYTLDNAHSEVIFRVRHLGISTVSGRFRDFDATVTLDPARLATLQTRATIQAASINTENERRDNHLKSADFFDVAQFPTLTFESRRVRSVRGRRFLIDGTLTMHGVARPITLAAEYIGSVRDGQGNEKIGFTATGRLNREAYGMTWNRAIEAGGVLVSKEVEIQLNVEATRAIAAATSR